MISKIENRFFLSVHRTVFFHLPLPYLQSTPVLKVSLVFQFCVDLVKRDNVRYGAINGCRRCCSFPRGPRQSWDGVAVPVSVPLSVFVAVPQTAGRHQTTGAATVAASVSSCQRATPRGARLLPQHLRGAVGQEAVKEQVVVLWGRCWCSRCSSHHHAIMLTEQREESENREEWV